MLTLIEAISLAGDRGKQNDDAWGKAHDSAWVIDGATDLHDEPLSREASDAAWLAQAVSQALSTYAYPGGASEMRQRRTSKSIADLIASWWSDEIANGRGVERWMLPTASLLLAGDNDGALQGLDLGDCRCFVLDSRGQCETLGGHDSGDEMRAAADAIRRSGGAPLRDAVTLESLRAKRAAHNTPDGYWVFGVQPECIEHMRSWTATPARPAHILICTDGFSALVDRYHAYDAAGLVQAALDKGLQELGRELRAIEAADAGAVKHPRFKPSDDATAVLLRLT